MGTDIRTYVEKRGACGEYMYLPKPCPFEWRSYAIYGFLGDVRNYSAVPAIAAFRGMPEDASADVKEAAANYSGYGYSWVGVGELLSFNYDEEVEDRRVTRQTGPNVWDGGCTADAGDGNLTTWREFLGPSFFIDLAELKECGADRIIFWFD